MAIDIYGNYIASLRPTTVFEYIGILLQLLGIIANVGSLIYIYNGYVPKKVQFKLLAAVIPPTIYKFAFNYKVFFFAGAIWDWACHFLGQMTVVVVLLIDLELLKHFLVMGSSITKNQVKMVQFGIIGLYLATFAGLCGFMPTLNHRPNGWLKHYLYVEVVYYLVMVVLDTISVFYMNILLRRFMKTKRIARSYRTHYAETMIILSLFGILAAWASLYIHIFYAKRSSPFYYTWCQYSIGIGFLHFFVNPIVFYWITTMNEPVQDSAQTECSENDPLIAHSPSLPSYSQTETDSATPLESSVDRKLLVQISDFERKFDSKLDYHCDSFENRSFEPVVSIAFSIDPMMSSASTSSLSNRKDHKL